MALPSTSIIVGTRNRAALLPRALRSALGQTYDDLEVIVVDDGSDDETRAVVEGVADPRLRYVRHDAPRGPAEAKNTGIALAGGEYVSFLDDDDEYPPQRTEILARRLEASSPRTAFAFAKSEVLVDGRYSHVYPESAPPTLTFSEYLSGRRFHVTCTLFRRAALPRFEESLRPLEFSDLILTVLRDHEAVFVDTIALTSHDDRRRPRLSTAAEGLSAAIRAQEERHLEGRSRAIRAGFYTSMGFYSMRGESRPGLTRRCFARAFLLWPTPWNLARLGASVAGGPAGVERYQAAVAAARRRIRSRAARTAR